MASSSTVQRSVTQKHDVLGGNVSANSCWKLVICYWYKKLYINIIYNVCYSKIYNLLLKYNIASGLPGPQLSNTLSNSRLAGAKRMLGKAMQLMDRMDDPSVPLHPSPTENAPSETEQQRSRQDENAENDGTFLR